jgi:putative membrane protein
MLNEKCYVPFGGELALYIIIAILGFIISFYMGDIKGNNEKLKGLFKRK